MAGDGRRPETIATIQKAAMIHGEGRTARPPRVLTTNADDRLPIASLGRVEGGDGFVEGRDATRQPRTAGQRLAGNFSPRTASTEAPARRVRAASEAIKAQR